MVGSFAFTKDVKIIEHRLFRKEPEEIAKKLVRIEKGEIIEEEEDIIKSLIRQGYKEVVWDKPATFGGIQTIYEADNLAKKELQENSRKIALDLKWVNFQAAFNEMLTSVNIALTKEKLRKPKRDQLAMRVISAVDELEREFNTFSELLREWYGLHFPEATKQVKSSERLIEIVSQYGERGAVKDKELENFITSSAGMLFNEDDIVSLQTFSRFLGELLKTKKQLENYLGRTARDAIPNISAIAGPLLGTRLLGLAGGLEKMAKMPASTIQLLGAEKALFRHLKEKTKAPKYGALFAHPLIQQAPPEKRGKVARMIAAKLSLAARMDFFTKEDRGESLKKQLDEDVSRVLST